MRVAIVHYWFTGMRGGEKVVEALCRMFPQADLFAHVVRPEVLSPILRRHRLRTTFIQRLPGSRRAWQRYLPLMPMALEQLDLRGYDLVLSSEAGPAKGVIVPPGAAHVCYCHSPMRYAWDMYHDYMERSNRLVRAVSPLVLHYIRLWDVSTAARVDRFVANSAHVRGRIGRYYGRDAAVVHPPVEVDAFAPSGDRGEFYLLAGQLVPYKRADLAVEAFTRTGKRLVVIGSGPERRALERRAGPNVEFLGWQSDETLREHYARCRALLFPGLEDFGMVPVEAMASGRPVIAYREGGALETVAEGTTGLFFDEQTPEAVIDAVDRFEAIEDSFSAERIAAHAQSFARDRFQTEMWNEIQAALERGSAAPDSRVRVRSGAGRLRPLAASR